MTYPEWQAKPRLAYDKKTADSEALAQQANTALDKKLSPLLDKVLLRAGIFIGYVPETRGIKMENFSFSITLSDYPRDNYYNLSISHRFCDFQPRNILIGYSRDIESLTDKYDEGFSAQVGEAMDYLERNSTLVGEKDESIAVPDPSPAERLYDLIQEIVDRSLDERVIGM